MNQRETDPRECQETRSSSIYGRRGRTTKEEYEDAKREAEESGGDPGEYRTEWRYYHWPESWGKIGMNQPLLRREMIGPEEVAEDLLNAEAALRRMRLERAG